MTTSCTLVALSCCVPLCVRALVGGCQRSVSSLAAQLLLAYVQYIPYICKSVCMYICMNMCMYSMYEYTNVCEYSQKRSVAILFRIKHAVLVWDTQLDFATIPAAVRSLAQLPQRVAASLLLRSLSVRDGGNSGCGSGGDSAVLAALCTERTGCVSFSVFVLFRFIPFHFMSHAQCPIVSCHCCLYLVKFFYVYSFSFGSLRLPH